MYKDDNMRGRADTVDDRVLIEECLCSCQFDEEPSTMPQRLWEAAKVLVLAAAFTGIIALAVIGALSIWLHMIFS